MIVLLFGVEGTFQLTTSNLRVDTAFALIPAGVLHTLNFHGQRTLVVYVEPHDPIYASLHLGAQGQCQVQRAFSSELQSAIKNWDDTRSLDELVGALVSTHGKRGATLDGRLQSICEHFNQGDWLTEDSEHLAEYVDLSPSRFLHLLKAELGVGTRRLKQHYRFKILVREVARGCTFTQAAHSAGFADSAHLSRAFVETFGLPPTHALTDGILIEIVD